jgi:hypothetical protein
MNLYLFYGQKIGYTGKDIGGSNDFQIRQNMPKYISPDLDIIAVCDSTLLYAT